MKPIDIILILAVVAILVIAIRRFVGTATGTRDCCSGAKKSAGKQFRARTIDDKDESHYPLPGRPRDRGHELRALR